jgi:glucose-6-phosphate isomerase
VIAKDFNTIEPGLVFRMFRTYLKERYGNEYNERVIVTGSEGKGQLHEMAKKYNYTFLPFPENIGGRFSVLTPVGLLPMAVYGIDIKKIVQGAHKTEKHLKSLPIEKNPAVIYPAIRKILFEKGFHIESMCVFEPQLEHFARWWLQEFGETEGKKQDVIFPTYFVYSEDLHSMGQYIQEGRKFVFETFIKSFEDSKLKVLESKEEDGFDYMSNRAFDDANKAVYDATLEAHSNDNIPVLEFEIPSVSEELFGELYYFFLFSVYISANLNEVNPFNQDGVDNYKLNMYKILGK